MTPFLTEHVGRILDIIPETCNLHMPGVLVWTDFVFDVEMFSNDN